MNKKGLCPACTHARYLKTKSGAPITLCGNADLPNYPTLPVLTCSGFDEIKA